ncbi:MAG: 50S ribosomal protein L29 [Terracidiphilus sp.]
MELTKIRNLTDDELMHQERTSSEQLFRIRFQVALGQSDGVKKLRQLRKEIAQIKTVARERELGIHSETGEVKDAAQNTEQKAVKAEAPATAAEAEKAPAKAAKKPATKSAAKAKPATKKKAAPSAKKKTGKAKGASK